MKSPRFLAALAMAAVLTTGVTTTAHAAITGGNVSNGQTPAREIEEFKDNQTFTQDKKIETDGDITIDGTFVKTVTNFPTPTTDGHYLRVSMPIKMDFTYEIDTHTMQSAEGVIVNKSVHATDTQNHKPTLDYKSVKVSLVDYQKSATGTTSMTAPVEFVNDVNDPSNSNNAVLLPFELRVESATGKVTDYSLKNIQSKSNSGGNGIDAIEIAPNSSLKLKIDQIAGQVIGNESLINQQTAKTSHSLKLKFEYDGK